MDTLLLAQQLSDDSSSLKHHRPTGGAVASDSVNLLLTEVTINLRSNSKHEMLEIRKKLQAELDLVRNLVNKIEGTENKKPNGSAVAATTTTSGVDNPKAKEKKQKQQRAHLPQLSVSVMDNNSQHMSDCAEKEKEKRTPKANKFYRNSDFLLAKDKFPPSESSKKAKPHGKKQGGIESAHSMGGFSNKALKNCSALLERLMKHKHGWVFNTPVDPVALGLRDYHEIIKHPMDLGTVKSRLDANWYKSPKEFAEDVRLTFNNAMAYNPKGQDVHVMAEQLLKIFEEKWAGIESEYTQELRMAVSTHEVGLPTPTSRKGGGPSLLSPSTETKRNLDRSDLTKNTADSIRKSTGSGRTPAPKKPKAREPNKRDMTYEEKQKLSSSLQNLPSDKLDDVVKIIKKRNSSLFQSDDEIEVDIDSFDIETLWELDRFVTNYKKMLSKNKRKAELVIQDRPEPEGSDDPAMDQTKSSSPVVVEEPKETKSDENNVSTRSPVKVEQQGDNGNKSCSASSSRGDGSGSSSSDSESESSSGDGSDAGQSPKKQV